MVALSFKKRNHCQPFASIQKNKINYAMSLKKICPMNKGNHHSGSTTQKTGKYFSLVTFIVICFMFTTCQDRIFERYKVSVPVYLSYEDLREAVKKTDPQDLKNPGKIYFKDNYIFINEFFKGIHIIDNNNPNSPVEKAFIEIPGNVDIAIKENTLYADSYIDLVALDISNMDDIKETYRIKDVFPYAVPPKEVELTNEYIDQSKGVVIRWEVKEIEKELTKPEPPYPYPYPYPWYTYDSHKFSGEMSLSNSSSAGGASSGSGSAVGVGGSMARFAIKNNALYVLTGYSIKVVDITNVNQPVTVAPGINTSNIETIFLNENYMYIGAQGGMSIYDITENFTPKLISTYIHITSCDPVVVEGDYAYVTLRSGRTCRNNFTNQLDVIDIKNKAVPKLLKSYGFKSPNGLGIENSILFLCDGDDGLKIFDASDIYNITQHPIAQFKDIQATDVIPLNGLLFMIGEDGFYQYDYSTITNVKLLSKIEVKK